MRRELYVPPQTAQEPLLVERSGSPFLIKFPKIIPEQPTLGWVYELATVNLIITHEVVLKIGQKEAFPSLLQCSLQLLRNDWVVGVWDLSFQMRLEPGTEDKRWTGEATIYQDLTNPIDYRSGDTLRFAVAGIVPGNLGGAQQSAQEKREEEQAEREIELLSLQKQLLESSGEVVSGQVEVLNEMAETINAIVALEAETAAIGESSLLFLEAILNRLQEME